MRACAADAVRCATLACECAAQRQARVLIIVRLLLVLSRPPQRGGGTVDETLMMRHALEGLPLPVIISDSATSSTEARQTLRDNPDTRLALLDDGLQHLPLVRCG